MFVIKRSGKPEAVHFDKITSRIMKLSYGLQVNSDDIIEIAKKVIMGIYNNVTTNDLIYLVGIQRRFFLCFGIDIVV